MDGGLECEVNEWSVRELWISIALTVGRGGLVEKETGLLRMSVADRQRCIEPGHPQLSVSRQCELIGLPRASYYRQSLAGRESAESLALMGLIDEEYTRHPFYGSRKRRDSLIRQGHPVNRQRVQRLMRLMGLVSVAPKPNTSGSGPGHTIYPSPLRGLAIDHPNQVWCTDLTDIRLAHGFCRPHRGDGPA